MRTDRKGHSVCPQEFMCTPFAFQPHRYIDADGSTALAADAWFFDLGKSAWRQLAVAAGAPAPAARKYHAAAHTYVKVSVSSIYLVEAHVLPCFSWQ